MKDLHQVPQGIYCYTYVDKIRHICPYWKKTVLGAKCEYLNVESIEGSAENLIWDQVKECGLKEN